MICRDLLGKMRLALERWQADAEANASGALRCFFRETVDRISVKNVNSMEFNLC